MIKRITASGLLAASALALIAGGCGPSTELTGTPIPNALPQTMVTGRPPELTEAGFIVQFFWSGFDPDGRIEKYQWKISNNGINGVSVQDTLTFCPVAGDTLNPWFETTSTDSVFFVSADIPNFPNDREGRNRSYQTHTFWVRAVDDKGGVDPTPAHISFTSVTLLPTVRLTGPTAVVNQITAERLPTSVSFQFQGDDPDFVTGLPTHYRYLWKRAIRANGQYCFVRSVYQAEYEYLASFADSAWSSWRPYPREDENRRVTLPNQPQFDSQGNIIYYLFAVQVQDTAGAVSIGRGYGRQVANVRISSNLAPVFTLVETYLGRFVGGGPNQQRNFDIAAGQPLNFSWSGDASDYAGQIVSYRYGWNVTDVNDPNDPNWELPEGNTPQHRRAPQTSFQSGVHTLTVQVTDNSSQVSRWSIILNVVPVPDPENQLPMLWVDDVFDQNSNAWSSAPPNVIPLDNDQYRDTFWLAALSGPGGVAGWNPDLHTIDTEDSQITYRDAVEFRNLVWIGRYVSGANSAISGLFRPVGVQNRDDADRYNWLVPYQADVGNVLLTGQRILNSFLAEAPYELPVVFESRETAPGRYGYTQVNNVTVRRAFGERDLPDGTTIQVGPTRYPYAVAGVSVQDIMSPSATYYEYNNGLLVSSRRQSGCVGLKAVVLDPAFKNNYMPGGGVFPDTIFTDPLIGWRDMQADTDGYRLGRQYPWGGDEFYNADIIARGTPFTIQQCDGVDCVEPMFRSIARYNWVRDERLAANPSDPWPVGYFDGQGQPTLASICGTRALTLDRTSALTHNRIVGFVARKTAPNKPSQVGDVVLGFDPYRFDNAQMTQVIRWVLDEHFGLTMNP